jgi:hypothetical protein
MWLLNTRSAELQWFELDEISGGSRKGYAILSHVWGRKEDTFQGVQSLATLPDHERWTKVSEKVKNCCKFVAAVEFEWVWIDTCCIDKSSSAELSEAINSMYLWYSRSGLCVVFLEDVPDREDPRSPSSFSPFRNSKWFRRGWTLQELIAPRNVVLISHGWQPLGTKSGLAWTIGEITGIDIAVLRHLRSPSDMSIAQRMSWAARRLTTRTEDEAYSLMGIFGVNMPTIYGEGRSAFRRLQEEILRVSPDHSLLAWSGSHWLGYSESYRILAAAPSDFERTHSMETLPLENYRKAFGAFENAMGWTLGGGQGCKVYLLHRAHYAIPILIRLYL